MEVLKATPEQKLQLEGEYLNGYRLSFIEDADGNWITGIGVFTSPNFAPIHDELAELEIIPHNPKKVQI